MFFHHLQNLYRTLDFDSMQDILLRTAAVLLCLTVHETCHGLAAWALGDPTAKARRRLSLNPLRHIDWLGLALMLVVGFGWAKPVPVDPRYFRKPKQGMALTALAGPASNFVLAFLALLLGKAVYLYAPYRLGWNLVFEFLLYSVAPLSIGLGLFNLLPIPPLDGAKVAGGLLPDDVYFRIMRFERYGMLLLLALSYFGLTGNLIGDLIYRTYSAMFHLVF